MKRFIFVSIFAILLIATGQGHGQGPLRAAERRVYKDFVAKIPPERIIGVEQFLKIYMEVMEGKRSAYLIDVRTHPEFYAFHIEGTDHIPSGHMYSITRKIGDPNAEIYIFCKTGYRAKYVAGFLYQFGYKNVWVYEDGIKGWARAGLPFVNRFAGKFKIVELGGQPSSREKSFRIREFYPY